MKSLKKILALIVCAVFVFALIPLSACGNDENVLKVFNCYEYIDESLLGDFEKYYKEKTGKEIKVEYSCFDTPEDAYSNLTIDGSAYDLVCPSDYMIEKMAREGMLQKFSLSEDGNYNTYASSYIKDVFKSLKLDNGETVADYAVGYMWGTLGLVYNSDNVETDDMNSWSILWENKYSKKFSIKNSVRDTYFITLAKYHNTDLINAKENYLKSGMTESDLANYKKKIEGLFNDTSSSTIKDIKDIMIALGNNAKTLEVDEGKFDIVQGKIDINFAWSGDAVYALDCADEEDKGVLLKYRVPDEGSNVWFDGWVIPKQSTKTELAKEFLEFLSAPENAIRNMDEIGYVSVIAGDDVFARVKELYEVEEGTKTVDLGYFFGDGDYIVKYDEEDEFRQLYTQYPPKDVVDRCSVMNYFNDEDNDTIMTMWNEFTTSLS